MFDLIKLIQDIPINLFMIYDIYFFDSLIRKEDHQFFAVVHNSSLPRKMGPGFEESFSSRSRCSKLSSIEKLFSLRSFHHPTWCNSSVYF